MEENTTSLIISGLIGLLTGAVGSLIAPWIHWGIEKRKAKREKRVKLIDELRSSIPDSKLQSKEFLKSNDYLRIRPFLSTELIDTIENPNIQYFVNDENSIPKFNSEFLLELDEIEIKWGLEIGKGKNRKKNIYDPDWSGMQITEITKKRKSE